MRKTTRPKSREAEKEGLFKAAMLASGIMPRGEPLARVVWACAEKIFAAAPATEAPFEVAAFANRMMLAWAGDVQLRREAAKTKQARAARRARRRR